MCKMLTITEVEIAKDQMLYSEPIHGGICPICGGAVVTEKYDINNGVYECIYCLFNCDDYGSFNDITGIADAEIESISQALKDDSSLNVRMYKSVSRKAEKCFDEGDTVLGKALLKYMHYMYATYN